MMMTCMTCGTHRLAVAFCETHKFHAFAECPLDQGHVAWDMLHGTCCVEKTVSLDIGGTLTRLS